MNNIKEEDRQRIYFLRIYDMLILPRKIMQTTTGSYLIILQFIPANKFFLKNTTESVISKKRNICNNIIAKKQ